MSKKNLLLLHGALGSAAQLAPLKEELSSHFDNIQSLTFSGHGGQSLNSIDFSIDTFTKDVIAFLDERGIDQTDIFGYSMGGYVALNLALLHPTMVGRIFTLGTKLEWSAEIAQKEVKMLNAEKIEEKVPAFAKMLEQRHAPVGWKEVLQKTTSMMINLGNGAALSFDRFKDIRQPVVIGIGDEDNMVTMEESETVANLLPGGELRVFKGFKHPLEQVDVKILAEEIKQFVS
ncbi:2-succinyl-6-hydroxy-2,4-cyclohexadiene-1-carboxylate synthase [Fulvivirga imtechensis AK7]|uniref:2-succinyl-6-hydroxy-2, 4-cyclohexadiene-1-carboxylate synthase n=1 Tax=Fulvivirga imtechensis AK7 TaxID=1237149 RepID=L8JLX6_9BACT|nr:alpha/beta hydrolase [Fulvivirga imtechensis]ELR69228.1 2-succinyl-6-hydroxy-2,4-cyclohexadiene-1-carboxylate synthase [Fulvivirga imtechensis AK7]